MPLLMLIRHGENDFSKRMRLAGRAPGIHLNERGLKQADSLAESLAKAPIKAIYSSPLERAAETAAPIAKAIKKKVILEKGIIESDVGAWQGKSIRRLALTRYWQIVQRAPSRAGHPGGETFLQAQTRMASTLEAICKQYKSGDLIVCVSHADMIKLAIAHFIGLPLDKFQRLACDTGSASLLQISENSAHLLWINRRPPFELSKSSRK